MAITLNRESEIRYREEEEDVLFWEQFVIVPLTPPRMLKYTFLAWGDMGINVGKDTDLCPWNKTNLPSWWCIL